ncbi:MAG: haloalkane dehalogenase [Nitrospirae bacterium]|nr:haloalkane dehalogenase [Nitrospirota bacterium]
MIERPRPPSAAFPFESRFVTVNGYRIHYVEEGRGDPVVFIHGNPTSSYLWRNILPTVARETNRRAIAFDLLGFGRSDKPDVRYSLQVHEEIVEGFIAQLGLRDVVLVLHDWGGALGGSYAVRHPNNIRGIALMEALLIPIMVWSDFGEYQLGFRLFRSPLGYLMISVMNMFVNRLLPGAVINPDHMTEEVMRNYRAPFPTVGSRHAIRAFPRLVPIEGKPEESHRFVKTIEDALGAWAFPVLLIRATPGIAVKERQVAKLKERLSRLTVRDFGPGLHYLQEDDPDTIGRLIVDWMRQERLTGPGDLFRRNNA